MEDTVPDRPAVSGFRHSVLVFQKSLGAVWRNFVLGLAHDGVALPVTIRAVICSRDFDSRFPEGEEIVRLWDSSD